MNGKEYVAHVDLFARNAAGALVVVAAAGKTCEHVDPRSLPHLLEAGDIRKGDVRSNDRLPVTKEPSDG